MAVLDISTRYVVSWALDDTRELPFVLEAVKQAFAQARPRIWNRDQGSHFTSPHSIRLLEEAGVHIRMDGKGRALDTICIERLWRTVKYEDVYLRDYPSPRDVRRGLEQYLTHDHQQRPHSALDDQTPAVYFASAPGATVT